MIGVVSDPLPEFQALLAELIRARNPVLLVEHPVELRDQRQTRVPGQGRVIGTNHHTTATGR